MNTPRKVRFSTWIQLIMVKKSFSILGLSFVLGSIFIMLPMAILIGTAAVEPHQKYDAAAIEASGVEKTAQVQDVKIVYSSTINGAHPVVITYTYANNGQKLTDKYETLESMRTAQLTLGSEIAIKTLNGESVILGMESHHLPVMFLYLFPLIFFFIGLPFAMIGLLPAWRTYKLYKHGVVKEGYILAMIPNSGSPITNFGQNILVNYYFLGSNGTKLYGKSSTTNFSIMAEHKVGDPIKIFVSETNEERSCIAFPSDSIKNNWNI